jgi:hypothetical protein
MIESISFKFKLFDASNKPIIEMPVNIQYYNAQEDKWISIYNDIIKEGLLSIEEKATSRAKALKVFLDKIKASEIPELRIVPEKQIFNLKKQEVLSITYEFEFIQKEGQLNFNFGSAWLLDNEILTQNDSYKTFFWITSPFSLVNQKENVAKISELEQNLTSFKNQNTKLEHTNKKLAENLQNISKQFEELNAENQSNLAIANERETQLESLNKDLTSFSITFEKLQKSYNKINGQVTELNDTNKILIQEKKELDVRILNLNNEVLSLQNKLEELSKEIIIEDRPVAVKNIYKNLVQELDIASELSKTNNYSLSNLSIKLKGVINQDANNNVGIQLFSKENANQINGNAISDISFDIIPTPSQTAELGKVPDVIGLTETAVTRILESVGLKLNSVYQKSEKSNGASFKQAPQKGTPINPNEFVTVLFSKNE